MCYILNFKRIAFKLRASLLQTHMFKALNFKRATLNTHVHGEWVLLVCLYTFMYTLSCLSVLISYHGIYRAYITIYHVYITLRVSCQSQNLIRTHSSYHNMIWYHIVILYQDVIPYHVVIRDMIPCCDIHMIYV